MDDSSVLNIEEFKRKVEMHKASGWATLPLDQKLFVCRYIKDGHSIVPMTFDGQVSQEEANRYLCDPMVMAAVADVGKQYAEITTFTRTGIQARLARALDMAMGEIPTSVHDKEGNLMVVRKVDHAAIAKYLTMAKEMADLTEDETVDESAPWAREDD